MSDEPSAALLSLREFLQAKGSQPSVRERHRLRREWTTAIDLFMEQVRAWLAEADPDQVLDIEPYTISLTEMQLGTYDVPALRISLETGKVDIRPIGRHATIRVPRGATTAAAGSGGRIDLKDGFRSYYCCREILDDRSVWRLWDEQGRSEEFDKGSFAQALQTSSHDPLAGRCLGLVRGSQDVGGMMNRLGLKYWDTEDETLTLRAVLHRDNRFREVDSRTIRDLARRVEEDLDDLVVLLLFSVFEADVRQKTLDEVMREPPPRHLVLKKAVDDAKETVKHGSFGRLTESYKALDPAVRTQVDQVRHYRNWVAHGRREQVTNNVDPQTALARLEQFLALLAAGSPLANTDPPAPATGSAG